MGVHITITSLEGNLTVSLKTENVHYPPTQEFDLEEFILQIELHMCAVVNVQKKMFRGIICNNNNKTLPAP